MTQLTGDHDFIREGAAGVGTYAAIGAVLETANVGHWMTVSLKNTGSNALTGFQVKRKIPNDDEFVTLYQDTDFNTCVGQNLRVSTSNLHLLAAGARAQFDVWIGKGEQIQILAKSAAATSLKVCGGFCSEHIARRL